MGFTPNSTRLNADSKASSLNQASQVEYIIGLAGNPNVGKSTVFNSLTGLKQHTGNWTGKTVTQAQGSYTKDGISYILVDIPGAYSLMPHSFEEEVARNFICFGKADAMIVVCDATCLERNLNLVLQILEITDDVVLCVNLMDEAKKKHISVDLKLLSSKLGLPVVGASARSNQGLEPLMLEVEKSLHKDATSSSTLKIHYNQMIETAIKMVEPTLEGKIDYHLNTRWIALRLIQNDKSFLKALRQYTTYDFDGDKALTQALNNSRMYLNDQGISTETLQDQIVTTLIHKAEEICKDVVINTKNNNERDRKIDRFLTNKITGIPAMFLSLILILWLTIAGANYPSSLLYNLFFGMEEHLFNGLCLIGVPTVLCEMLIYGMYRVLAWVVAVMLPPMAIFFPLFTLLEDLGYLPRVAFNLDKSFKKCSACGKQALTMCMGLGCNAVGVVGCRIIDSPRERLIATLTNSFMPCNGRFPTLISIISMFFVGVVVYPFESLFSTLLLAGVILLGILMTFFTSSMLSKTILKGLPSSFALELPPYRKPLIGKVLIRSLVDRTLQVLKRAVLVAAPAGLVIWLMANVSINEATLLIHCSNFLDPFARLMGLDGVILLAFILGFPANEIVVPIMIMTYLSTNNLMALDNLSELKMLLVTNGWTPITALCTLLFILMHWPCSTTCLTIKKETQSLKWTLIAFFLPALSGFVVCFVVSHILNLFL